MPGSTLEYDFRSPFGSTEECVAGTTEFRLKARDGSSQRRFLRLVSTAPEAEELYERIVALARPVDGETPGFPTVSAEELLTGDHAPDLADRPFVVLSAEEPVRGRAEDRIAAWLDAPNPALGDECPRVLLRGDEKQRARLAAILSALEQGAFS